MCFIGRVLSLLSFLGVLAGPALVNAESVDALLRKAVQLRKEGKDQEAFKLFEEAVAVERTPRTVAQLGLSEQALGLWAAAEGHLTEALGSHEGDAWIQKNRPALERSLKTIRAHLGSVEIWGIPSGADVTLNGKLAGKLPATGLVRVEVGHVTYTVHADGYLDATGAVDVRSGDAVRENVVLVAAAPVRAPATVPLALNPPPAPDEAGSSLVRQAPPAEQEVESPVYTRWWFWTAIGAVVAGGVVTAVVLTRGKSSMCDANVPCSTWGS